MATKAKKKAVDGPACADGLNLPRQTREEYAASVLQQIGAFEERLDELESDMETSGWDDIGDYRGQLDDLLDAPRRVRPTLAARALSTGHYPTPYPEVATRPR